MTSSQDDKDTTERASAKPAKHPFIIVWFIDVLNNYVSSNLNNVSRHK